MPLRGGGEEENDGHEGRRHLLCFEAGIIILIIRYLARFAYARENYGQGWRGACSLEHLNLLNRPCLNVFFSSLSVLALPFSYSARRGGGSQSGP